MKKKSTRIFFSNFSKINNINIIYSGVASLSSDQMDEALKVLAADWSLGSESATVVREKMHKYIMALVKVVLDQSKTIEKMKIELADAKKNPIRASEVSWASIVNGNKQSDQTQALIATVNKEINEKARIENNIVISGAGVEEESKDEEKVEAVLKALKLDRSSTVKRIRRIKSKKSNDNQPNKELDMIVVEFKDEASKQTALREARNLRNTENFKNVYINPDKTPSERALERELRTARNKRNADLSEVKANSGGRHRYGIQPSGHPMAGKKFYWGIRWNALKEIYFD